MHAPLSASQWWRFWREVATERARIAARLDRIGRPVPRVTVGRRRLTAAEVRDLPPTGWARLDAEAMQAHRARVRRLLQDLEQAAQHPERAEEEALQRRAHALEAQAHQLAQRVRTAPVATLEDVAARLDLIAARWSPAGILEDERGALAEVLALLEAISRSRPGFTPAWGERRRMQAQAEREEARERPAGPSS